MAKELTYLDILADLRSKHYKPVYYLMGEEAYFIDLIADFIEDFDHNLLLSGEIGEERALYAVALGLLQLRPGLPAHGTDKILRRTHQGGPHLCRSHTGTACPVSR